MPSFKAISGHSPTCRDIREYLYKDGRALADDFLNVIGREHGEVVWDSEMDYMRAENGTQNPVREGAVVRRYQHFIVSPDPRDELDLDEFREYVNEWARKWFDGGLGRFQVAIVYHDDNLERVSRGDEGILHAHIVVNNAELDTGRRISGLLSSRVIDAMQGDLNIGAYNRGWRSFTADGRSMTPTEMGALNLSPSRGKGLSTAMGIADIELPEGLQETSQAPSKPPMPPEKATDKIPADTPKTPPKKAQRKASKPKTRQADRLSGAERKTLAREGASWKQDIRDRVMIARRCAQTPAEFVGMLNAMGIGVSLNAKGEIKYSHPSAPDTRCCLGPTLGRSYSLESLEQAFARKHASRRQRAVNAPGRERPMPESERYSSVREGRDAPKLSRAGTGRMQAIRTLIKYNDAHGIRGYADYGDDAQARAMEAEARRYRMFDPLPPSSGGISDLMPQGVKFTMSDGTSFRFLPQAGDPIIIAARSEREERGEGGDSAVSTSAHGAAPAQSGEASADAPNRTRAR